MWTSVLALTTGAAFVAHASLVPAGGGVVAALLSPGRAAAAVDPAAARVSRLRALAAADRLADPLWSVPADTAPGQTPLGPLERAGLPAASWVQLAAVCTLASAVVHACAGPHHATEHLTFGLFFYAVAFVQFAWTTQVLMSPPSRSQLRGAVWLNLLLIVLWLVTRTVGLPGLLPGPEEVGAWDLASKVWELGAIACCLVLLAPAGSRPDVVRNGPVLRTPVRVVAVVSVLALAVLAVSGPPQ